MFVWIVFLAVHCICFAVAFLAQCYLMAYLSSRPRVKQPELAAQFEFQDWLPETSVKRICNGGETDPG